MLGATRRQRTSRHAPWAACHAARPELIDTSSTGSRSRPLEEQAPSPPDGARGQPQHRRVLDQRRRHGGQMPDGGAPPPDPQERPSQRGGTARARAAGTGPRPARRASTAPPIAPETARPASDPGSVRSGVCGSLSPTSSPTTASPSRTRAASGPRATTGAPIPSVARPPAARPSASARARRDVTEPGCCATESHALTVGQRGGCGNRCRSCARHRRAVAGRRGLGRTPRHRECRRRAVSALRMRPDRTTFATTGP